MFLNNDLYNNDLYRHMGYTVSFGSLKTAVLVLVSFVGYNAVLVSYAFV